MTHVLSTIKQLFTRLTPQERGLLLTELESLVGADGLEHGMLDILSGKSIKPKGCPHCQNPQIGGHGSFKDRPRYRCKGCGKTFTALTGTALDGVHDKAKFLRYVSSFALRLSLRDAAQEHLITLKTSFDWRHRLMASLCKAARPKKLEGTIQADEKYIPYCCKGSGADVAKAGRKARKSGSDRSTRGISNEQVCVLSVHTDEAELLLAVKRGRIDNKGVDTALSPLTRRKTVNPDTLVTDGSTAYTGFARKKGMEHHVVDSVTRKSPQGSHIQNVNNLHSRLEDWMRGFHGVASKYLQRYLDYFIILAKVKPFYRERVSKIIDFVLLNNNLDMTNILYFNIIR